MLTIIFAVQKLVNNIIFRMNRMMPLTRNRLSDAFTTLFSQHASAGPNRPAKYILNYIHLDCPTQTHAAHTSNER